MGQNAALCSPPTPKVLALVGAGADVDACSQSSLLAPLDARCAGAELGPGIRIMRWGFHRQVAVPFIASAAVGDKGEDLHLPPPALSQGLTAGAAFTEKLISSGRTTAASLQDSASKSARATLL